MNDAKDLLVEINDQGVCFVTLSRPDLHNAFNDELISSLTQTFLSLADNDDIRFVVLKGAGKSFSAGADLNMMKAMKTAGPDANREQAIRLATMFDTLNAFPKPLIGIIHGAAIGGGIGLVASCDYVLASTNAIFALSETKLGMVPATIGPYVMAKIGESNARAFFISGKRFTAQQALTMHLVHEVVAQVELESAEHAIIAEFMQAAPHASMEAKRLIQTLQTPVDIEARKKQTADLIATIRETDEAQEGMDAFLNKRKPSWSGQ